jgi:hypothetical protein
MPIDAGATATLVIGVVAAAISLFTMWRMEHLQQRLTRETADLQTRLTRETEALQERLRKDEASDSKRRFVIDLWDRISGTSDIDPQNPVGPDVRRALNAMELIAMCWEGNIVDHEMVERIFGKMYRNLYNQIRQCQSVPGSNGSGQYLLDENPTIIRVHRELEDMVSNRGKLERKN